MWLKNVNTSTNSFPKKCPFSFYTSCPLSLVSQMWIPESPPGVCCFTFQFSLKIAAPKITVAVRLLVGGMVCFGISEKQRKNIHPKTNDFAHICRKNACISPEARSNNMLSAIGQCPMEKKSLQQSTILFYSFTSPMKFLIVK